MTEINLFTIVNNIALQVPCFGCKMQQPFLDDNGVLRCRKADKCQKVIHYAKVEYKRPDPEFDDIEYGRCAHCGQFVSRPDGSTKCPCCGFELIWEDGAV